MRSAWHKGEVMIVDRAQTNLIRCASAAKEPLFKDTKTVYIEATSSNNRREKKDENLQTMGWLTDRDGERGKVDRGEEEKRRCPPRRD